ncbi:MAG TPA: thioredoxin-dependent thiol peroxidase [Cyclobacteriaceae bacterium]|nr:thioredoxin-dependent thiol peroxidase [Cyclobacteriaceae bacterium]HRJ81597.1 thioredoxin-dependent thiol peroxidase [Cyclobacteriaceae bacterium]
MALSVGSKAPDFTVNDQDGKPVKLSDFTGKKVVLYFYPKDQTPGCTAEACNLRDNYKALQKQGYEVLGVSTDNEKSHQKFIAKEKLPFRLLADVDKTLHTKYGTWVEKSMYGRKYMGTARVTFIINEKGVIDEIIEKVDTKNHTDQILNGNGTSPSQPVKKATAKKPAPKKKALAKKSVAKKMAKKKK